MATANSGMTGGQAIVAALAANGVRDIFCVPGESYLAVLDALHDADIRLTLCRQESGAAMMAVAAGKLTGRPGICFVTRGPGATNASAGVHIAMQDSTPMILFVGQIERAMRGREAFQELDYRAVFGTMAKWATEIDEVDRIPEILNRAFATAVSGRPGPVVVALPEDMLTEVTTALPLAPAVLPDAAPSNGAMADLEMRLATAERPLLIAGGSGWTIEATVQLRALAERAGLPVAASFRRQDLFSAAHPNYVGDLGVGLNPALAEYVRASDLVLLLGGRLSEIPSQSYSLIGLPQPDQVLVHVHSGPEELGRVYRADLAFAVTPPAFLASSASILDGPDRTDWIEKGRRAYLDWTEKPTPQPGRFNLGAAICALRDELPADAILSNGAGNYAIWLHRYYRHLSFGTQLGPTSGSMGFGLPAAIAAKRLHPDRTVVAFAGDGCFMMTCQEFATAAQYRLGLIVVVVDNGMYGTIRMHQERHYPGRVVGTDLRNPDFAAFAAACGGYGERVETTEDFLPAFRRAAASGQPAILHCMTDPEALTPGRSLSDIRDASAAVSKP